MKFCLCKDCETVEVTSWLDMAEYRAVFLCKCCCGFRYFHWGCENKA